ncbi:hypothetical protein MMC29_002461 [Sticta canariensis]|nr:hypothetical protein [Sticta canariensis]
MASNRTVKELAKYVSQEYGGITPSTGTPYPCTQQQIDTYTMTPYCDQGNGNIMPEYDAICMLQAFLNPNVLPTPEVTAALHRIAYGMSIKDNWYPDIVIKAMHDIDTAFFMGLLRGSVRIQWVDRSRIIEEYGPHCASHLGITQYIHTGCTSILLNLQPILGDMRSPRQRMWQCLFHELIHAFSLRVCPHTLGGTAYDRSKGPGWQGGHGYMFRTCLLAIEERTKRYFDGFCIATPEDTDDYRSLN